MRQIHSTQTVSYPEGGTPMILAQITTAHNGFSAVTVTVNGRQVIVKGPRGSLKRDFGHVAIELHHDKKARTITVGKWFGLRKQVACVRTIATHLANLVTGVTKVTFLAFFDCISFLLFFFTLRLSPVFRLFLPLRSLLSND